MDKLTPKILSRRLNITGPTVAKRRDIDLEPYVVLSLPLVAIASAHVHLQPDMHTSSCRCDSWLTFKIFSSVDLMSCSHCCCCVVRDNSAATVDLTSASLVAIATAHCTYSEACHCLKKKKKGSYVSVATVASVDSQSDEDISNNLQG
jgi:hypothetical protein